MGSSRFRRNKRGNQRPGGEAGVVLLQHAAKFRKNRRFGHWKILVFGRAPWQGDGILRRVRISMLQSATKLAVLVVVQLGLSGLASAQDLPIRERVELYSPAAIVRGWSGFYIGANGGGAIGTSRWCTDATIGFNCISGDLASHDLSGAMAGGQAGYRWQTGVLVFGVEGSADWTNLKGENPSPLLPPPPIRVRGTEVKSLYSATGSIGVGLDRWLTYFKAGWAGAQVDLNADALCPCGPTTLKTSTQYYGGTAGAGLEFKVTQHFSIGAEYDYYRLGRSDITNLTNSGGAIVPCAFCNLRMDVHSAVVRANLTYNVNRY
jgi:outer membrane immunogenic protein